MGDLRILCLDDDLTTLRILGGGLMKALPGDTIETCDNSPMGLELLLSKPYDILITDLHMPDKNGLEVIDQLVEHGLKTDVIVLTADSEVKTVVEAMSKGARDYIHKPIFVELLLEKIEVMRQERHKLKVAFEAEAGLRTIEAQAQETITQLSRDLCSQQEKVQEALKALDEGADPKFIRAILSDI